MTESAAVLKRWMDDPRLFVRECLGITPDPWQDKVLWAFSRKNRNTKTERICMRACKNPGKTAVLSWLSWLFLLTRSHCHVAAISITAQNLRDNLWTEMAIWQSKSKILQKMFRWNAERIVCVEDPSHWWMSARSFAKSADQNALSSALAGTHADNVMFVIDEAGDIPPAVLATAEAALGSGIESRILMAGNPTSLDGSLYRACVTDRQYWDVHEVTGDPDNPLRAPRVKLEWAKKTIEQYGRDFPWVKINVLGEFPDSALNTLLSPDDVQRAMARDAEPHLYEFSQKRLGVDVAFMGDDLTVLFPRQGLYAFDPIVMAMNKASRTFTNDIAARIQQVKRKWKHELAFVDCTGGHGEGVVSALGGIRETGVVPVNFAGKALKSDTYANRRAEMWWGLAEWVKAGGCLPNVPELVSELSTPTYTSKNGKLLLEPKEFIKERLGRSPDRADALALTFATPDEPAMEAMERKLLVKGHPRYRGLDPNERHAGREDKNTGWSD